MMESSMKETIARKRQIAIKGIVTEMDLVMFV